MRAQAQAGHLHVLLGSCRVKEALPVPSAVWHKESQVSEETAHAFADIVSDTRTTAQSNLANF